jgi:urease accessory protein UreF
VYGFLDSLFPLAAFDFSLGLREKVRRYRVARIVT